MKSPLEQAKELQAELKKQPSNVEAMLRLTEFMAEYEGEDELILSTDLVDEIEKLEKEQRHFTGIKKLDKITDGFRSNQVIVISSPPKSGKTQLCVHLARQLGNATMFLFEETAAEVLYKYHKKGLELPRFITPKNEAEMSVEDLYRKMIEAWAKYNSKVFFIDHLHFVIDKTSRDTGKEIMIVMEQLKRFAKTHGFTIFIVAHMTKGNFEEPPSIDAIRDSAHIPALADTVILLWRERVRPTGAHKNVTVQTTNLLMNVALNRKINFSEESNTGLVDLTFDTDKWTYNETDWYTEWLEEETEGESKKNDLVKNLYGNKS